MSKDKSPASSKGLPVLSVLYGFLALFVLAVAGWLVWVDTQKDADSPSAAQTILTPPIAASSDPAETLEETASDDHKDEPGDRRGEDPEHTPDHTPEKEDAEEDKAIAEEETTAPSDLSAAEPPAHDAAPEATVATQAKPSSEEDEDHSSAAEPVPAEIAPAPTHEKSEAAPASDATKTPEEHEKPAVPEKSSVVESEKPKENAEKPVPVVEEKTKKIVPPTAQGQEITAPDKETPLPPVPDPELTKNSDYGLLPIISPTGRLPWRTYARPFEDPLDRPRIAIVVSDMGVSAAATRSTIQNLPGAVTLSFSPHSRDLQSWIEQARAAGHEVLLQLPMEPFGYPKNDPGPHSLLTSLTDRENLKRLDWMLGRFVGYSGVTNQMGSKFTATAEDIRPVLDVIKSRGLLFLDGRTSSKSVAGQIAFKAGVPVAINNRFLDNKADRATIDARLRDLEKIARSRGTAVGVGYPYPVTLERLNVWAQSLARKGLVLVPISAATNRQEIQ